MNDNTPVTTLEWIAPMIFTVTVCPSIKIPHGKRITSIRCPRCKELVYYTTDVDPEDLFCYNPDTYLKIGKYCLKKVIPA